MYFSFVSDVSDLVCQHCNETLLSSTDKIVLHTKTCAAVKRPDASYRFVCCFCHYKTDYISNMKSHIRRHTGDKPFQCPYCSYNSTQSQHIKTHIQIRHY